MLRFAMLDLVSDGRVSFSQREHDKVLDWDCQAELFRVEEQNADNIRLDLRLVKGTLTDVDLLQMILEVDILQMIVRSCTATDYWMRCW